MGTESQNHANRKNAARSTGPKTPQGKAASARNAIRHGLSSAGITVLPDEDPADLEALTQTLNEEHRPQGDTETFLVRQMLEARWKLARIQRLEGEAFDQMFEGRYGANTPGRRVIATMRTPGNILDKLERYTAGAERRFYKALHELQQIRARAKQNKANLAQLDFLKAVAATPLPDDPWIRTGSNAPVQNEPNSPAPQAASDDTALRL